MRTLLFCISSWVALAAALEDPCAEIRGALPDCTEIVFSCGDDPAAAVCDTGNDQLSHLFLACQETFNICPPSPPASTASSSPFAVFDLDGETPGLAEPDGCTELREELPECGSDGTFKAYKCGDQAAVCGEYEGNPFEDCDTFLGCGRSISGSFSTSSSTTSSSSSTSSSSTSSSSTTAVAGTNLSNSGVPVSYKLSSTLLAGWIMMVALVW